MKYFLLIDGVQGNSTDATHQGWFEIDGFDFDASNVAGGTGKATLSPLSIAMAADGPLAALLGDVALGKHISSIKVEGVTAGPDPAAVYDLTLAGVLVQQVHDSNGSSNDRLVFDYDKIGLITKTQDPTGALSVSSSFGFDVATNATIDPATLPTPTPGTTPPATPATTFYLLIDGVQGNSTDAKHQGWFKIDGFDFDASNVAGGTGKATLSPLSIAMAADGPLAALLGDVALGKHISSIKVEGVTAGPDPAAVYDLTLADVLVQQVHDSNGSSNDRLVFDYDKIGLITKTQDPTGALSVSSSFGFDVATNATIDPATLPTPTPGTTPPATPATTFYLLIDGVQGNSTDAKHQGWFKIDGFDFDASNVAGGTGKATLSPLSIAMAADGPLAALLGDVALGKHISSIKVEGVTAGPDPAAVYDLTLAGVLVQQVHDSNGSSNDRLVFDYDKIGLITKTQDPTGALSVSSSFGFDVATNATIDPATLPTPTPGTTPPATPATTFYLLIDGVQGNSTDAKHQGWFEIDGFDFDASNVAGGTGKATLSPLSIAMAADGPLAALLGDVALGKHISSIKVEGVTAGPDPAAVYDLTLADVLVQQVHDSNGSSNDRLVFDYDKIGLITKTQDPTGALSVSSSFGFDVATNATIDPATLPTPTPGTTPPATPATTFYLLIDGVQGNSTDAKHQGWFEIDGFDFDASNVAGGTGKATLSPLSIAMAADGPLAALLGDVALGKHISSIKVEGVTAGPDPAAVYDLTLADVLVQQVHDSNGSSNDRLVFDYDKIGLITKTQDPTGALSVSSSFGFDVATNATIDPATLPTPTPGTTPPATPATTFYLLIDGVQGNSTDAKHQGWFKIDGFDFDASNVAGGTGKATLSPLSIAMAADGPLAALLGDVALGKHISSIKVEGVTAGPDPAAVYDLTLAGVLVQQVHDSNGSSNDRLVFDYDKIGLITKTQDPTGALSVSSSFGFDVATNATIDPATLPTPTSDTLIANLDGPYIAIEDTPLSVSATEGVLANDIPSGGVITTPPATPATTFYLLIDGVQGNSTDAKHQGWFKIDGFDFDASNVAGGIGKATLSPLSIAMAADGPLAALLGDVALGKHISSIKVEGVTAGPDPAAVYDLTLADVLVQQVHDSNGSSNDRLVFDYDKIGLITKTQDPTGALSVSSSFGFDVATNATIDPATLPTPTPGTTPPATPATTFYLLIDGVQGNSTDAKHQGWFKIDGFDFDASNVAGGTGKATLSPLSIAMAADGPLAALLGDVALGKHISSIKVEGVTAGPDPAAVYDLTLAGVLVQQVHDSNGSSNDRLVFDYDKIGLITKTQDPTGALSVSSSFGFDVATNATIDPATLPTPTPGTTPPATPATTFYLLIDGVQGNSTDAKHQGWFKIDGFDFDASNVAGGTGKATLSPLSIAMAADGPLAALLGDVALGKHISSIKVEGVTAGPDPAAVYDLTLADVLVQQVHDSNGSSNDRLVFDYDKIGLITKTQDPTGALSVSSSFGFDVATNATIDPATLPTPTPGTTPPATPATTFYLLIDGVQGNSTDAKHQGWFKIDGFDFDASNVAGGTGKATLSPLSIAMAADGPLAALLGDVALGKHISSIKVEGVTAGPDPAAVYDLTLAGVLVQQVHDSNGSSNDRLVFDYDKIGLITKTQDPTGALSVSSSFGFDVATNATIDPATLPTPTPGTTPPATPATTFYLLIDGVQGNSTDAKHQGWFKIDGFDFDASNVAGGTGKATLSPLSIAMAADGPLAALLGDVALGKHISSIKVEGVTAGPDPAAVYDLTLADVLVQQVHDSNGSSNDRLVFDYDKIGLITKTQDPTGALSVSSSFGFDVATNATIDPATLPTPTPGTTPPATPATTFYLLIDGVQGNSTDAKHQGWFKIDGFDFDASNVAGGTGKATLSPLSIAMAADGPLAALLGDVALGKHISSIKVEGVTAGPDPAAVYDLTLAGVLVQQVHDSNGSSNDRLVFDYDKIGLITKTQDPTGALSVSSSFGFDVATNATIDPATLPTPTPGGTMTAELVSTTTHGKLTLNPDGSFAYLADANFNGVDSFVYHDRQGTTISDDITVQINVAPVNDAPVVTNILADVNEDTGNPVTIAAVFTDPDINDHHTFAVDANGTVGTVANDGNGTFSYDPNGKFESLAAGATAFDSFRYTVVDAAGASSTATVTVTVHGENDAPIATNIAADANEDTGNPVTIAAVFTDPDIGDSHNYTIDASGTVGKVVNDGDGTFSYDPNGKFEALGVGETAFDSFKFTVIDGSGAASTATASVTVHGENDAPITSPDIAAVHTASTITVDATHGVLANDHDPDTTDRLSVSAITFNSTTKSISSNTSVTIDGAYGVLTIGSDGGYSYTAEKTVPSQGLAQDNFVYTAIDGHGGATQATLTVAVTNDSYVIGTPGATLTGGTGKQVLDGSLGQQTIVGGNGKDVLVAGPGDTLTGGNGADTFVFRPGFGQVKITDFDPHIDTIQWDHGIFDTISSILSHTASDGHGGTIITDDGNSSVTLVGVSPLSLHPSDFLIT